MQMELGENMRKTEDVSIQFNQEETVSENINKTKIARNKPKKKRESVNLVWKFQKVLIEAVKIRFK